MSFFPAGFDPRADVVGALDLVNINTPDGDFGFLLGVDGKFTDVNGKTWWGSTLLAGGDMEMPINGTAPSGSLTLSFFQDPGQPDLIGQMMALGAAYVAGRSATFYVQPLTAVEQFHAPILAPIPLAVREMRSLTWRAVGALERSITVAFEGAFAGRNTARGYFYTTADHARLIGEPNSSLQFMPSDTFQEQPLFA